MNKPTVREVSDWLSVSVGMAQNITTAAWSPDAEKFKTRGRYLERLCKEAMKHGHRAPELLKYLAEHHRPQARAPEGPEAEPIDVKPAPAETAKPGPSGDQSYRAIEDGLAICTMTMRALGKSMIENLRDGNPEAAAITSKDFTKLLAELRQTSGRLEELKRDRAELLPRDDVLAAAAGLWVSFRAMGDQLIGQMVSPGNLPAWLAEVGGSMPDTRAARQTMQERIRTLVEARFAEMSAALVTVATPEGKSPAIVAECRAALAVELRKVADTL